MSTAEQLGISIDDPRRVVYVREGSGPCVIDAWEATTGLARRLASAQELVLLDPLSFPYEQLSTAHRAVPVVVVLPSDRTLDDLVALLADPLLRHLTPLDRVLASRDVLDGLAARGVLGPVTRVALEDGEDPVERIHRMWRTERTVTREAAFGAITGIAGDLITRHVRELGAHQRSDLAMLRSTVRPGDTVLDIGSHIGAFAVPLAQSCGEGGRLVAFEANPAIAELLAENLRANQITWAEVHHAAVAERSGVPTQSSATVAGNTGAATTGRAWDAELGQLRTIALDDWWEDAGRPRVDVIKLDVEGHELLALQGARRLLGEHHPVIQLELAEHQLAGTGTSGDAVLGFLRRLGYEFHINALERNRRDDLFELRALGSAEDVTRTVQDILCVVGDDRLPDAG